MLYNKKYMKSFVAPEKLKTLNNKVYEKGLVDREHLIEFLTYIDTNDAQSIITEVKNWLQNLHDDPHFNKIRFPQGDIDAVIGDLDSYGRVQAEHILQFKQNSNKIIPQS